MVWNELQMDKASIIKDAIEYVLQLQQLERQLLAELAVLETAGNAHHLLVGSTPSMEDGSAGHAAVSPTKKMKRNPSFSSHSRSSSPPVDALEVRQLANKLLLLVAH